ncbi:MAG: hypothetical protein R8G66_32765 [Cytophagales bacterium]|nr:hypothetical protein [Cytophagales bacterium]
MKSSAYLPSFLSLVLILCFSSNALAQNELKELKQKQKLQKKLDKIYKDKVQSLEKGGYTVYASTKTMGEALYDHDKKIESGLYEPQIFVDQRDCFSANSCYRKSSNDAATSYASRTNAYVRGEIYRELRDSRTGLGKEQVQEAVDKFGEIFKTEVSANVSNQLELSYALISEKKGNVNMQLYFLVLKEEAKAARKQALTAAMSQYSQAATEANLNWMQSISDFVDDVPSEDSPN